MRRSREQKIAEEVVREAMAAADRGTDDHDRDRTEKLMQALPKLTEESEQFLVEQLGISEDQAATMVAEATQIQSLLKALDGDLDRLLKLFQALPGLDAEGMRLVQQAIERSEGGAAMQKSETGGLRERGGGEDDSDLDALDRALKSGVSPVSILKGRAGV